MDGDGVTEFMIQNLTAIAKEVVPGGPQQNPAIRT
jgi:hypothetical protein